MIKREKIIFMIFLLVFVFSINLINAQEQLTACKLNVSMINQDPYPGVPGEYVKVLLQVSGLENNYCESAKIELVPDYPFSLDKDDPVRILEGDTFIAHYDNEWLIPYKLRIDKDALRGENELIVNVYANDLNSNNPIVQRFNIEIEDVRTNFDAVIQEITDNEISVAIANTGKHTANSVIVRVPNQGDFRVTGTDGQMVGNLDSGDYTIVSFNVVQKRNQEQTDTIYLSLDIDYTDSIGERREVLLDLPLSSQISGMNAINFAGFNGKTRQGQQQAQTGSLYSQGYFWIIILVIVIILYFIYKKIIKNRHKKKNSTNIPEWTKLSKKNKKEK